MQQLRRSELCNIIAHLQSRLLDAEAEYNDLKHDNRVYSCQLAEQDYLIHKLEKLTEIQKAMDLVVENARLLSELNKYKELYRLSEAVLKEAEDEILLLGARRYENSNDECTKTLQESL